MYQAKKHRAKVMYHSGMNQAVDIAILHGDSMLIIQRGDTKKWALPGGMVENNEDLKTSAARELSEETGIKVKGSVLKHLFHFKVDDPRNTDEAWIETDVFCFTCMYMPQVKIDLKEVKDFKWITKQDTANVEFHANHKEFIAEIFEKFIAK